MLRGFYIIFINHILCWGRSMELNRTRGKDVEVMNGAHELHFP